jgi:hypothetical protein
VIDLAEQCDTWFAGIVRPDPLPGEVSFDDLLALLEGV